MLSVYLKLPQPLRNLKGVYRQLRKTTKVRKGAFTSDDKKIWKISQQLFNFSNNICTYLIHKSRFHTQYSSYINAFPVFVRRYYDYKSNDP